MAKEKGIIILTLVISRAPIKPGVTPGLYMFKLFKLKTALQCEVDEYIVWKAERSFTASTHKEILTQFVKRFKYKNSEEVTTEDINTFYREAIHKYEAIERMSALRCMMRYFSARKMQIIDPRLITDSGIRSLQAVPSNDTIPDMTKRRPGRPANVEFIKRVKYLRDEVGMDIRAIARAENKYPSHIHHAYHYDLSKLS